ncbi:HNH endonuclease [Pedobacter punctiformis]|uniref:HNH endonuclease signature motif containing protein n=1 Tax=Pedobacter punctiformis TaxID=3004097 RepID=A0ABT4L820_9SPHI|nr:HNH endonuclease signature motif containing protein [Pedobacter sp. HCMS5-2]MCZ4244072.1 HNH endonuclease signature motif containing protein [Pedobacter sp. HCMS5-2]
MEEKLWVLKTVHNDDRALQTVDDYNDKIDEYYNYDSKVANSKNIKPNDYAILINKTKILGFLKINSINEVEAQKVIRYCAECGSSTIDKRTKLKPTYRCNKGHTFNIPEEKTINVKKFNAQYKNNFIPYKLNKVGLSDLRPFYKKNYNQNMSMQALDIDALRLFSEIKDKLLLKNTAYALPPYEGSKWNEPEGEYHKTEEDERESVLRQIKARRGQQKFRDDLRKCYGDRCMVTGCEILDILEAAHIIPYRGKNDNHPSNGLLLRADVHTLFDLDLLGINPEDLTIHVNRIAESQYGIFNNEKLLVKTRKPNKKALIQRWINFNKKIKY